MFIVDDDAHTHIHHLQYLKELDLSLLPEVHALSSGLKALTAEVVSAGVERCRKLCGGHGCVFLVYRDGIRATVLITGMTPAHPQIKHHSYLKQSGLPDLFGNYVAVATFEGTQQILEPQTARFILKIAQDAQQGKAPAFALSSDFDYITHAAACLGKRCPAGTGAGLLDPIVQLEAFESRVCALLLEASEAIQEEVMGGDGEDGGASVPQALVRQGVLLGRLARAHCQLIMLRRFHESVARQEARLKQAAGVAVLIEGEEDEVVVGQAEVRVLRQMVHLFALSVMEAEMAEFRAQDYLSAAQAAMCGREVLRLCRLVRAEAVWCVRVYVA